MSDAAVGRLLAASLHQAIADVLPNRIEFYESWLNPSSLRDGRIGLAPLTAVLSFLRQERQYDEVVRRAGEYTAEWTVANLPALQRAIMRAAPPAVRLRLVLRLARRIVRATFGGSRATVRFRNGGGALGIQGSVFCTVRERTPLPLCEFYAAALRKLMHLFTLHVEVATSSCRASGGDGCVMSVLPRAAAGALADGPAC